VHKVRQALCFGVSRFSEWAFLCLEDDILPNKNVSKRIHIMGVYIQAIYYCWSLTGMCHWLYALMWNTNFAHSWSRS
jgi:hypothetical protein